MALDAFVKTNLVGSITLADGTGTPVTMTCAFDMGDLSFGPLPAGGLLNEAVVIERRGGFVNLAPGARIYPSGSFSAYVHQFTDATADVLIDFLLRQGKFSANTSTLGGGHYTLDLTFDIDGTAVGGVDGQIVMSDCLVNIDSFSEAQDGDTISLSFTVYGAISGSVAAAEWS